MIIVVGTMLWRMLQGKVFERETHELLPHMVDGIVRQYYGIVYFFQQSSHSP